MRSLTRTAPDRGPAGSQASSQARDAQALKTILIALGRASSTAEAINAALATIKDAFGWAYASYWTVDPDANVLRFALESGAVNEEFHRVTRAATFAPGIGVAGRTWSTRALVFVKDLAEVTDCVRAPVARSAGVKSGVCLPISINGYVTATMDFFTTEALTLSQSRTVTLESVAEMVSQALTRIAQNDAAQEMAADSQAVTEVLTALADATDEKAALNTALEKVRAAFGWAYGSIWRVASDGPLRFDVESGTVNDEFRRVTLQASFAQGVGLSGRAWKERRLVFVKDLAEVTDCVRAPVARSAGVKSGVCLPIIVDGQVIATMDFFSLHTLTPSPNRLTSLSSVGDLLGQALSRLRRLASTDSMAGELSASVEHVAVGAARATAAASQAVDCADEALAAMASLGESSQAIGNIAKIISNIAGQTNLLALNATIEAARAGDAGRGFAVVASEVKELARATASATDDVAEKIIAIQKDSERAALAIEQVGETIRQIHEIQADLASVLEEQSTIAQTFRAI